MTKFFREHILGILLISAAGSLLANLIAPFLPSPTGSGIVLAYLLMPVPLWILFPYSVLVAFAIGLWVLQTRAREHADTAAGARTLAQELAAIAADRDSLRQECARLSGELAGARAQAARDMIVSTATNVSVAGDAFIQNVERFVKADEDMKKFVEETRRLNFQSRQLLKAHVHGVLVENARLRGKVESRGWSLIEFAKGVAKLLLA